jgi:hypothetical protein
MTQRGWILPIGEHDLEAAPADSEGIEIVLEDEVSGDEEEVVEQVILDTAGDYQEKAEAALADKDHAKAIDILHQGLADHPYELGLCETLEKAEKALTEQLRAELMVEDRIPRLLIDNPDDPKHQWTPSERYLVSRIDGVRNLKSIIMVSPIKEVEALRSLRSLQKRSIIELVNPA